MDYSSLPTKDLFDLKAEELISLEDGDWQRAKDRFITLVERYRKAREVPSDDN